MNTPITTTLTIDDIPDVLHEEVRTFIIAEITDAQGRKKHVLRTSSHMRTDSFIELDLISAIKKECGVCHVAEGCKGTMRILPHKVFVTAFESVVFPHADEQTLHILCEKEFPNKHVTVTVYKKH